MADETSRVTFLYTNLAIFAHMRIITRFKLRMNLVNTSKMRYRNFIFSRYVCAGVLTLAVAGCGPDPTANPTTLSAPQHKTQTSTSAAASYDADFPAGYDYPATTELEDAIAREDRGRLEEHARSLWNGINQQRKGQPWWRAWETAGTLFEPKCSSLKQQRGRLEGERIKGPTYHLNEVVKYKHPTFDFNKICDGPVHQNNGDILIVDVSYNPAAAAWVREQRLNDSRVLDKLREGGESSILPFPAESIVTKHMYWPVKNGSVPTAIPVWARPENPDKPVTYRGYETWDNVVAVSPKPEAEFATVTYLYGVSDIPNRTDGKTEGPIVMLAPTLPIDAFIYHQVTEEEYSTLSENDRVLLDLSASWAYGGTFEPNDYLVSVAMHINTREIPAWTLQSIWWEPPSDTYKEPYRLVVSDGLREPDGSVRDAFNPFIELAARHPVLTDCRNCHIRAGWQVAGGTPKPSYKYPENYGELDWIPPDAPEFKGITMLDFQWSTADRASENPPEAP